MLNKKYDWGKISGDYAKYRDIYPEEFYQYIISLGLCKRGQKCLDIGTGTGVLPRNLYKYGAEWVGTDVSENQIIEAKKLAYDAGMNIDFYACDAKDVDLGEASLDVITACQCIWYLDHTVTARNFAKMLKNSGSFLVLYMGWLPFTRESWHGRMRACRGTGVSMAPDVLECWDNEHREMLNDYPEKFRIRHYVSVAWLKLNNYGIA